MPEPIEHFGMRLTHALDIEEDCRRIYRLLGVQAAYPYKPDQIVRALLTLRDNYDPDAVSPDELTLWKRKWTATNAQLQKYKKQVGRELPNDESSEVAGDA